MNNREFFEDTILNNGATLGEAINKGFTVSLPHFNQCIERGNFSLQHVKDYINCNKGALNESLYIGSWIDNNIVYLDVNEVILDKRKAIEVAYQRNQQAIYDNANKVCIDLPEPQRSGTITQQKAYLTQVIDKLCAI